jgi:hypothetical protein
MNTKTFFFWSGVAVVALVGSWLVIRWLVKHEQREQAEQERQEAERLAAAPRREAGFHAILKEAEMMAAPA